MSGDASQRTDSDALLADPREQVCTSTLVTVLYIVRSFDKVTCSEVTGWPWVVKKRAMLPTSVVDSEERNHGPKRLFT